MHRHFFSALVQNVPGVLSHVAGMFSARGYNIIRLKVEECQDTRLAYMEFSVVGDKKLAEQVRRQLEKIVTVISVDHLGSDPIDRPPCPVNPCIETNQDEKVPT